MEARPRILLLDDDPDLLDLYQEMLSKLPSQPEIHTATSGARAIALLDSEPFRVLICDLKMPKMDGLQVLSIVRRKHPQLRTVVLTSLLDEQLRSRVYAIGVDLFWQKPSSEQEIKLFLDCIESLLEGEHDPKNGFRGVQSKSLVDIIQSECLAQNSVLLRINNGPLTGKLWIQNGELIDAAADDLGGEAAFKRMLCWKTGNFEMLPAEPARPRAIFKSYHALLLESAQALDENHGADTAASLGAAASSPLVSLAQFQGLQFVLALKPGPEQAFDARGLEDPEPMARWARETMEELRSLGDRLEFGALQQVDCLGPQRHVALAPQAENDFCTGWQNTLSTGEIREMLKKVLALWAS
jgi:CheY-like chemotaxis protein